jgi:hypothetical protein
MATSTIELGAVFKTDWDERPIRVLAFDDIEVLHDCWWPHLNRWGLSQLRGKASYYRFPTGLLRSRAVCVRVDRLTPAELAVHRPDLPLRLCRFPDLHWTKDRYPTIASYASAVEKASPRLRIDPVRVALDLPAVVLMPFGPKGSRKRGSVVKARSASGFSALELLWLSHNLQSQYVKDWRNGVGIYRSGFEGGVPSYYLWGASDRAGIVNPASAGQ